MKFTALFVIIFTFYCLSSCLMDAKQLTDGQYITTQDANTIEQQHLTKAKHNDEFTHIDYITTSVPKDDKINGFYYSTATSDEENTDQSQHKKTTVSKDDKISRFQFSTPATYDDNQNTRPSTVFKITSNYLTPSPHSFNGTDRFNYSTEVPFGYNGTYRYNVSNQMNNSTNRYYFNGPILSYSKGFPYFNSSIFNITSGKFHNSSSIRGVNSTLGAHNGHHWSGINATLHHFGGFNSTNHTNLRSHGTFYNGTFLVPRNTSYFHLNGTYFAYPYVNHTFSDQNNFTRANYSQVPRYNTSNRINSSNTFTGLFSSPVINEVKSLLSELRSLKSSLESKLNDLGAPTNDEAEHGKNPHYHNEKETIKVTEKKRRTERKGNSEIIEDSETKKVINRENSWDE